MTSTPRTVWPPNHVDVVLPRLFFAFAPLGPSIFDEIGHVGILGIFIMFNENYIEHKPNIIKSMINADLYRHFILIFSYISLFHDLHFAVFTVPSTLCWSNTITAYIKKMEVTHHQIFLPKLPVVLHILPRLSTRGFPPRAAVPHPSGTALGRLKSPWVKNASHPKGFGHGAILSTQNPSSSLMGRFSKHPVGGVFFQTKGAPRVFDCLVCSPTTNKQNGKHVACGSWRYVYIYIE